MGSSWILNKVDRINQRTKEYAGKYLDIKVNSSGIATMYLQRLSMIADAEKERNHFSGV